MSDVKLTGIIDDDGDVVIRRLDNRRFVFIGDVETARALTCQLLELGLGPEKPRTAREAAKAMGLQPEPQDAYVDYVTGKRGSDE
jgi:hypothetical protein